MKKFLIILVTLVAAVTTFFAVKSNAAPEPASVSTGTITYDVPNIMSGTMSVSQFEKIFDLLPYDVQSKMIESYNQIVVNPSPDFYYNGVHITHADTLWTFNYQGCSVKVNASSSELLNIFRIPTI